jgi:hydrogenase maturation protease
VDNSNTAPAPDHAPPKVLLLGLGNDLLTDDAIGLHVARQLQCRFEGHPAIHVRETTEMGLALLDFLTGYPAVVIVDSIQTGQAPPGFVHELEAASLKELTGRTPHFLGVGETLALGRLLELPMPAEVTIYAIEVEDPFTLGTQLTPALQAALPGIVERIAAAVGRRTSNGASPRKDL